ncbi:MAG: quinolinate synthase NadA [Proteobacteria bacterium]|nr:quinolinate synthase NadA [Pseudomonadota bacterium]
MHLSFEKTYAMMQQKLAGIVPEFELEHKARLAFEINELKVERNAIILGHNYMEAALFHSVADITGDSLELCRKAAATSKDVIVFCGVEFMAETAKILNPTRQVLIPSKKAGCSLAQSITAADVRKLREQFPGVPVVTYINSYADVKAETDICCTSGNAAKIVAQLDSDQVIFIPDEFLARNIAKQTGKTIIFPETKLEKALQPESGNLKKVFIGWHGRCEVHELFTVQDIEDVRAQYPDVVVLAHPECPPEVVDASDFSGSTSAMIQYVKDVKASRYLLLTECAMADNIIASNRDKELLRLCSHRCPHMAQITLEDTLAALKNLQYEIHLDEDIRLKAKRSIDRMLEMS